MELRIRIENEFIDIENAVVLNRYAAMHNLTEKTDVYSFGVVILEIISGRKPVNIDVSDEKSHIVSWVSFLYATIYLYEKVAGALEF